MRLAYYLNRYDRAPMYYRNAPEATPITDGMSTAVRGLGRALVRQGHEVTILAQGRESVTFDEDGVRSLIFQRPGGRAPVRMPHELLAAIRANTGRWDAIVLNGIFDPKLVPVARAANAARLPYIVATHAPYHPAMLEKHHLQKRVYWSMFERRLLQESASVQVLSSHHPKFLLTRGVTAPVVVVANGVDATLPWEGPVADEPHEPVRLGYLGRIDTWHKGLDILIEGFARAREAFPFLHLDIQGPETGDSAALRAWSTRLGVDHVVSFLPPSAEPATSVIAKWDALIAPSRFDGFPLTVIEAMLAARPVICSVEAGAIEHVRRANSGIGIVPNAYGVASGIERLLSRRQEWAEMGLAGRQYVIAELGWDKIAANAARAYASILTSAPRPPETVGNEGILTILPPDDSPRAGIAVNGV